VLKKLSMIVFLLIICIISALPASAQVVVSEIQMDPPILLPGDEADAILKIVASEDTSISSVVFFAPSGIKIEPTIVSSIGQLKSGSTYELPFTVKANEPGKYTVDIRIRTSNGSVKQIMVIRVEDRMPELILNKSIITLNEVNTVQFHVISPIQLSSLVVEPMFNATPSTIYVGDGQGAFTFYPTKPGELVFKIKFYNGRNYHEITQTIRPEYRESGGVFLNVSAPSMAVLNDAIPIDIGITNLRDDAVYSIKLQLTSNAGVFSSQELEIPSLASSESRTSRVLYSPDVPGEIKLQLRVSYKDTVGIKYSMSKEINIRVINETPVILSNLEVERDTDGIRVSGDVSNVGLGNARNILLEINIRVINETPVILSNLEVERDTDGIRVSGDVSNVGLGNARNILLEITSGEERKTYYLGTLAPSDFDSFEFKLSNASDTAMLKIIWMNDVGRKIEVSHLVEIPASSVEKTESNLSIIAIVAAVAVVIIVALIWIRSR